jgi:hypothetical protein
MKIVFYHVLNVASMTPPGNRKFAENVSVMLKMFNRVPDRFKS